MIPKLTIYHILATIILFIVVINALFFFVTPQEVIAFVGTENMYAAIFITAAIGGLSSFTGVALFTAIAVFSAGGADPLLLGLVSGVGIFISDSIFFFLTKYGKKALPEEWGVYISKALHWVTKYPSWAVLCFVFLYLGFTPLPADILMATLALSGYSYRKIAPILFLSGITVATLVAYLGNFWAV